MAGMKDQNTGISSHAVERVYVDSHVHIYDCYDIDRFFDAAEKNFLEVSKDDHDSAKYIGVLCLTEIQGLDYFERISQSVLNKKRICTRWKFEFTDEEKAIIAISDNETQIIVVAGRQIETCERLEVLSLATRCSFPNLSPISDVIQQIIDHDGLAVLPWGVGKWFGKRGLVISNLIENSTWSHLYLGDNSGRPIFWPTPIQFHKGNRRSVKILPGSDPLPLRTEYWRPGSFGFILKGRISLAHPISDIKKLLNELQTSPEAYGQRENPIRFLRNQLFMQIGKSQLMGRT